MCIISHETTDMSLEDVKSVTQNDAKLNSISSRDYEETPSDHSMTSHGDRTESREEETPQIIHTVDRKRKTKTCENEFMLTEPCGGESDGSETSDDCPEEDNKLSVSRPGDDAHDVHLDGGSRRARRRLIRTICMIWFYITLGAYSASIQTAMLDLQYLFHSDVAQLSRAIMTKSFGMLAGSLIGAPLSERCRAYTDLCLFLISCVGGLLNITLPWAPNLILVGAMFFLQGICHGAINNLCSSVTIAEWGKRAAVPINMLHAFHNIGMLLGTLTVAPFLSDLYKHSQGHNHTDPQQNQNNFDNSSGNHSSMAGTVASGTRVHIPFAIHGVTACAMGLVFLTFYLRNWTYKSAASHKISTVERQVRNDKVGRHFIIILSIALFLIMVCVQLRDRAIGTFNFYIAVESSLSMSKATAAVYSVIYNASGAIGRVSGTILARFLSVHWLLFGSALTLTVDTILLVFLGLKSNVAYWILTCVIHMFAGPFHPSLMAWADLYVPVGGALVAVIDTGMALGGFTATGLGGYLLNEYGATALFIQLACGSTVIVLLLVPLQVACTHVYGGSRFKR